MPMKMSGNLPSNFSDLGKDWKMELKSGKMVKSLDIFFVLVKSYSMSSLRLQRIVKKALFLPFLEVSIDHLFDNLESGKKIIILEKSLENVLNFGSKNLYEPCK